MLIKEKVKKKRKVVGQVRTAAPVNDVFYRLGIFQKSINSAKPE